MKKEEENVRRIAFPKTFQLKDEQPSEWFGYYPPTFVDCPETSEEGISDHEVISVLVPADTGDKIEYDISDNINSVCTETKSSSLPSHYHDLNRIK